MKNYPIIIIDRSSLAHNLYKMFFQSSGLTIFPCKTIREWKEYFESKSTYRVCLINSNIFGNHFDYHWEWLQNNPALKKIPKIFLCEAGEKKIQTHLKMLPQSHLVTRPFFPKALEKTLYQILRNKS